jgi:hypothetical protein
MEPEALARKNIDLQLEECGWLVQNRDELNIFLSFQAPLLRAYSLNSPPLETV